MTDEQLDQIINNLTQAILTLSSDEYKTASVTINGRTLTYRNLGELYTALRQFQGMKAEKKMKPLRFRCS